MAEQKTILEWLEQAKSEGYEWADAAIENAENGLALNDKADCISDAIAGGFAWGHTEQGVDFWLKIASDLQCEGK